MLQFNAAAIATHTWYGMTAIAMGIEMVKRMYVMGIVSSAVKVRAIAAPVRLWGR
jgi:hypothetical protein